jgi:DNA-3-methyladenine glycosylase
MDDFTFLLAPSVEAAPRLLGCYLVREQNGHQLAGRIVEVEAYAEDDEASHSFRGKTNRTAVMFGPHGHLYVYFTYGMHYCANVVTGQEGYGAGVLLRAIEPLEGEELMEANRGGMSGRNLTNGPGKLTQALAITMSLGGHDLHQPPLQLVVQPPLPPESIVQTTRIGISKAAEKAWRFYEKGNPYVSKLAAQ